MQASSSPPSETPGGPTRPRRRLLRIAAAFFSAFFALAVAVAGVLWWGEREFRKPGPLETAETLIIPKGAGLADIAGRLDAAGVIDSPLLFRTALRLREQAHLLKAGEYEFAPGISQEAVARQLIEGRTVVHRLTLAEGLTTAEILQLVSAAEPLDGELTVSAEEGALLPETYNFSRGDSRNALVERMRKAMSDTLDELWEKRAEGLPYKSKHEALVMASIIEKETGVAEERRRVAAVFVNRLKRGMRLESDPTVIYGMTRGQGALNRPLLLKDLDGDTAHNTYRIAGLPPGPIANPGRASIEAALDPADTKDLFFVADGSGGHAFAETLEQHNRNVARWRAIQRQRRNDK